MFQFRRFPSCTYGFSTGYLGMSPGGLLHSDIRGSRLICSSPRLFAAYHVFRRLLVPRHSPCALCSLTIMLVLDCSDQLSLILPDMILLISCPLLSKQTLLSFRSIHSLFNFQGTVCQPTLTFGKLVGSSGIEPPTSRLSGARSNRLSYEPMAHFGKPQSLPGGDEGS